MIAMRRRITAANDTSKSTKSRPSRSVKSSRAVVKPNRRIASKAAVKKTPTKSASRAGRTARENGNVSRSSTTTTDMRSPKVPARRSDSAKRIAKPERQASRAKRVKKEEEEEKEEKEKEEEEEEKEEEAEPMQRRIRRKTKELASEILASPSIQPQKPQAEKSSVSRPRKRQASSGQNDAKGDQKKARPSQLPEDPYDFEAYAWGSEPVPKKRKAARPEPAKKTQKARKARKAMAHMFFIQPSRAQPKKRPMGAEREEPSPSIADEITEIALAPPSVDDEVIIGPRLCAGRDRFLANDLASTPRLSAAPIVRPPVLPNVLSPINSPDPSGVIEPAESGLPVRGEPSGAAEPERASDVRPLVESSRANSQEALEDDLPASPARSEEKAGQLFSGEKSDKLGSGSPNRKQKKSKKEGEKDEFEQWLSKFNQELSDIEAFQLSMDDSR